NEQRALREQIAFRISRIGFCVAYERLRVASTLPARALDIHLQKADVRPGRPDVARNAGESGPDLAPMLVEADGLAHQPQVRGILVGKLPGERVHAPETLDLSSEAEN